MKRTELGTIVVDPTDEADLNWLALTLHEALASGCVLGLDVETKTTRANAKQPDPRADELVGIGIAVAEAKDVDDLSERKITCIYVPWHEERALAILRARLPAFKWYAFNAMFDATVLRRYGIRLGEHIGDARIVAYMLGEPEADLKTLLDRWLHVDVMHYSEVLDMHRAEDMSQVPVEAAADYCAFQDAAQCIRLADVMVPLMTERSRAVYEKVELPMVGILVAMTERGIRFDREKAIPMLAREQSEAAVLEEIIADRVRETGFRRWESKRDPKTGTTQFHFRKCEQCGGGSKKKLSCDRCWGAGREFPRELPFNPGSTLQIREWLYEYRGAEVRRYAGGARSQWRWADDDSGDMVESAPSTDSLALLQLKGFDPAIPLVLTWRKKTKRAQFLAQWIAASERDGRLHTMFTNTTVATGRLSSRTPNLQQVTLDMRELFITDED